MKTQDIIDILKADKVAPTTIQKVESFIHAEKEEAKANKEPKGKNSLVVIVHSPTNDLNNLEAWVVKQPVCDTAADLDKKMKTAAARYNSMTRKGRKAPAKTLRELFLFVQRKFTKNEGFQPLNKESVEVIVSDGNL